MREENFPIKQEKITLYSNVDNLPLEVEIIAPENNIHGIVQISHGMAEHKERYEDFMKFLAKNGYVTVIHDHRGHGKSVQSDSELGYFYTEDINAIVEDLHSVTTMIQQQYPKLPLYLFSHSMGTLVARNYLKQYDDEISKLILCGPPTKNSTVNLAIMMANISKKVHGEQYRNHLLNNLAFGSANKRFGEVNAWLSSDSSEVERYQQDPLCGYIFTNNGFLNLSRLLKEAFNPQGWRLSNPNLPILLIAGADDPVIQNETKFYQLKEFLGQVGYQNISSNLYKEMRHEILNEKNRQKVYQDVLEYLQ